MSTSTLLHAPLRGRKKRQARRCHIATESFSRTPTFVLLGNNASTQNLYRIRGREGRRQMRLLRLGVGNRSSQIEDTAYDQNATLRQTSVSGGETEHILEALGLQLEPPSLIISSSLLSRICTLWRYRETRILSTLYALKPTISVTEAGALTLSEVASCDLAKELWDRNCFGEITTGMLAKAFLNELDHLGMTRLYLGWLPEAKRRSTVSSALKIVDDMVYDNITPFSAGDKSTLKKLREIVHLLAEMQPSLLVSRDLINVSLRRASLADWSSILAHAPADCITRTTLVRAIWKSYSQKQENLSNILGTILSMNPSIVLDDQATLEVLLFARKKRHLWETLMDLKIPCNLARPNEACMPQWDTTFKQLGFDTPINPGPTLITDLMKKLSPSQPVDDWEPDNLADTYELSYDLSVSSYDSSVSSYDSGVSELRQSDFEGPALDLVDLRAMRQDVMERLIMVAAIHTSSRRLRQLVETDKDFVVNEGVLLAILRGNRSVLDHLEVYEDKSVHTVDEAWTIGETSKPESTLRLRDVRNPYQQDTPDAEAVRLLLDRTSFRRPSLSFWLYVLWTWKDPFSRKSLSWKCLPILLRHFKPKINDCFVLAALQTHVAQELLELLFETDPSHLVGDNVVLFFLTNGFKGSDDFERSDGFEGSGDSTAVFELLLSRRRDNRLTEELVAQTFPSSSCAEALFKAADSEAEHHIVSERTFISAEGRPWPKFQDECFQSPAIWLRHGWRVQLTEATMRVLVRYCSQSTVRQLLDSGPPVAISNAVLQEAKSGRSADMIPFLLKLRSTGWLGSEFIESIAIVQNPPPGNNCVLNLFLDPYFSVECSERTLLAVLKQKNLDAVICFLDRYPDFVVSHKVIGKTVCMPEWMFIDVNILQLLFQRSHPGPLSSDFCQELLHRHHLPEWGLFSLPKIHWTQDVLVRMVREVSVEKVKKAFLASTEKIQICREMMEAAVHNEQLDGDSMVEFLLKEDPVAPIDDSIVLAAISRLSQSVVKSLILRCPPRVITETTVLAALKNKRWGRGMLQLLFSWRNVQHQVNSTILRDGLAEVEISSVASFRLLIGFSSSPEVVEAAVLTLRDNGPWSSMSYANHISDIILELPHPECVVSDRVVAISQDSKFLKHLLLFLSVHPACNTAKMQRESHGATSQHEVESTRTSTGEYSASSNSVDRTWMDNAPVRLLNAEDVKDLTRYDGFNDAVFDLIIEVGCEVVSLALQADEVREMVIGPFWRVVIRPCALYEAAQKNAEILLFYLIEKAKEQTLEINQTQLLEAAVKGGNEAIISYCKAL